MKTYFTSESVTCGHPDKVCDQIADAVLDDILANDPDAHVACEVTACTGEVHLMGEITSSYVPDYEAIARKVIAEIGYTVPVVGFDAENVRIRVSIHTQSPDIARGVDRGAPEEAGAGDQGMMFGYACCETGALMPLPITLANRLTRKLEQVRREKLLPYLLPDGKAQVSVEYEDGKPKRISAVVVSAQHSAEVGIDALRDAILEQVIFPVLPPELLASTQSISSTRRDDLSLAGPRATAALPAARSSPTPMAAWRATAAGRSRARIRARSTARALTWRAISPRTLWPRSWPTAAKSSLPMPSASPTL